ncbi:MAG: BlaI/MecI/CopY family transcriptional regulator [Cytophagales bacterium]|nr:BlaI/MecI/CopY family transcriptional regulator [Armatimonadota bacterium]
MKPPPIGDQELAVLQFMTDRGAPATVREVTQEWGERRDPPLARTTILTMMERLRKKNLLVRARAVDGTTGAAGTTFQYSPALEKSVLMRGIVQDFVDKTLGGSVSPFVAYLADSRDLSHSEIEALRRLVENLAESSGSANNPDLQGR